MASIITTISLSTDDKSFLDENNLSPTSLIKGKINEIREFRAKPLLDRIERLLSSLEQYRNFLIHKGLVEEFSKGVWKVKDGTFL
jgi:hypothetical protein